MKNWMFTYSMRILEIISIKGKKIRKNLDDDIETKDNTSNNYIKHDDSD